MGRWGRTIVLSVGVFGACADPYNGDEDIPAVDRDASADDGGVVFEAAAAEAEPPVDANGTKPAVDASCDPCDCDNDGFRNADAGARCADAGPKDCDDFDPRAHPDAGFLTDQPTPDTRGDWNCNGTVERQYNSVNVQCADYTFVPGYCVIAEGFVDDPPCGATGTYVKCTHTGTACKADITEMRTQGCK